MSTRTHPDSSRCRNWYAVQEGWVHAAGRTRLVCSLRGEHAGMCESVDGWLWRPGALTWTARPPGTQDAVPAILPRERYPQRRWRCRGQRRGGALCGKTALATENGARAGGWHIVWVERRPDAMCPRCAAPAPPPLQDRWSLDRA